MKKRKAAKPARPRTAKKQVAVKKQSTHMSRKKKTNLIKEIGTLLRKAAGKGRSGRKSCSEKKLMQLCQHFADRYGRAIFALGTCPKIKHRDKMKHPMMLRHDGRLPKMAPNTTVVPVVPEVPVSLSLHTNGHRLIKTGTLLRSQAEQRAAAWRRVYKEATFLVN